MVTCVSMAAKAADQRVALACQGMRTFTTIVEGRESRERPEPMFALTMGGQFVASQPTLSAASRLENVAKPRYFPGI
jgi:hypothetical protein